MSPSSGPSCWYHPAEKHVGYGHAKGYEENDERGLYCIVHRHGHLAYDTVHIDERKQGAIHQHTGYHRDDTKYFLRVAETLNFSQAARELFITQSTLSQQILHLE